MSCDSQGQVIICDSQLSHSLGSERDSSSPSKGGKSWSSSKYSGERLGEVRVRVLRRHKRSDVSKSFSRHVCHDSVHTHGGGVSLCVMLPTWQNPIFVHTWYYEIGPHPGMKSQPQLQFIIYCIYY